MTKQHRITLLPGDGIGPEIISVAVEVLGAIASKHDLEFSFTEALIGGAAIDETGEPLPEETLKSIALLKLVLKLLKSVAVSYVQWIRRMC